jgi:hypothetical protein
MTEPGPEAKRSSRTGVAIGLTVGLLLCGLAALCLAGVAGGAVYLSQATAQAHSTQTSLAAQQQATATAVAETVTMQAQVMAETATAVAKSAKATATAQALAAASTATVLSDYAASTATAQARSEASTATAEVRALATPTLVVAAPMAENWSLVAMDTFEANVHAWPMGDFSDQYGSGSRALTDGKYHWEANANQGGGLWWVTYADAKPADFYVGVDVSVVQGDISTRYGLVLRHDGTNYDFFDVGQNGRFAFYRWEGGQWTTVVKTTASAAIDPNGVNRLAALVQGQQFTFFINNQQVATATESHLRQGQAGMGLNLGQKTDKAVVVEFDNFELRAP